jgi:FtsH-binding integral membrane protein
MSENQSLLHRLEELLSQKKSKKFYAEKLGISEFEVNELMKELREKDGSLKNQRRSIIRYLYLLMLLFLSIPTWGKLILFSIFSFINGIILSFVKKKAGEDIIRLAMLGTISIFAIMFSIGTFLIMSGIRLGYKTAIFLLYGLLLLILAQLFNIFVKSSQYTKILSGLGVILFSGYIIYDTNKILQRNYYGDFISASIDYYLDIINIFIDLVNINDINN